LKVSLRRKKGWRMKKQLNISHTRYAAKVFEFYTTGEIEADPFYPVLFAG